MSEGSCMSVGFRHTTQHNCSQWEMEAIRLLKLAAHLEHEADIEAQLHVSGVQVYSAQQGAACLRQQRASHTHEEKQVAPLL